MYSLIPVYTESGLISAIMAYPCHCRCLNVFVAKDENRTETPAYLQQSKIVIYHYHSFVTCLKVEINS